MAEKKIEVVTVGSVKHEGKYQPIGATIKVWVAEAERLIGLGAVELPRPKIEPAPKPAAPAKPAGGKTGTPAIDEADLIAKIDAAENLEVLQALLTEEKPTDAVAAAAQQRWDELEANRQ